MKFFVDECCSAFVGDFLAKKGNSVQYAAEIMAGALDDQIDSYARDKKRILISGNVKDFYKTKYKIKGMAGKILISSDNAKKQVELLGKILSQYSKQDFYREKVIILDTDEYEVMDVKNKKYRKKYGT